MRKKENNTVDTILNLTKKLRDNLKIAMKSGDSFSLGVLRMLVAAMQNKEIENRGKGLEETMTDDEVFELLTKEAKRREEAAVLYDTGGRADLADQERKEAAFIKKYLPAQLSRKDIELAVNRILLKSNFDNFGIAMKAVMAELKNIADAKIVSEIIKQKFL